MVNINNIIVKRGGLPSSKERGQALDLAVATLSEPPKGGSRHSTKLCKLIDFMGVIPHGC